MGIIGIVAAGLSSFVGSILISLTAIIATVVSGLIGVLSTLLSSVIIAVSGTVSQITSALTATTTKVSASVHTASSNVLAVANIRYSTLSAWAKAVKANFTAFLEAIHYKALLEIHDIAYILSSGYRGMLDKVYLKLGDFSDAIGRHTGFLEMAIQLARKTSLQASAFLGKRFDIAEVIWLKDFNSLLTRINETTAIYAANPSQIWHDIDELITKPATDASAEAQLTMFATVQSLADMLKAGDDMLTTVQTNFGEVIDALPERWRNDLIPIVENVQDDIRHWRDGIFAPTIETIDKVLDVVYIRTTEARQNMQEIAARLAKGGDILAEIDNLPNAERSEQEYIIAGVSSRVTRRRGDYFEAVVYDNYETLESILAAVKFETPPELWQVPERIGLITPIGKQAETKKSWFVGDY